jgi:hypothetical protein
MATLERTRKPGSPPAGTCPALALAVLISLAPFPARAQEPGGLPPPGQTPAVGAAEALGAPPPPGLAPPAAPGPACCPGAAGGPAPDEWSVFIESGPVFPVSGGFQHQLDMGWTVDIGAREVVCGSAHAAFFTELAGEYETLPAREGDVRSTDVTAELPNGRTRLLSGFHRTRLVEVDHLGVEGALGLTWDPGLFDAPGDGPDSPDRRLFLISRVGLHGGATHAVFHETPTAKGLRELRAFEAPTKNRATLAGLRLFDPVESHQAYFGAFTTLGVGLSWCHASLAGMPLGDVSLTAEAELGYHWDDLGQFNHEATFLSVSPKLTLAFSF